MAAASGMYYKHITIVNDDSVGDAPNCGITNEHI
jgi:hypothetical protein